MKCDLCCGDVKAIWVEVAHLRMIRVQCNKCGMHFSIPMADTFLVFPKGTAVQHVISREASREADE